MYSGQEIVSQEECKIVLAEFYEGVDCYNETEGTIKFTLQDWATATVNGTTLHTQNFSCTPVVITEFNRVTIATLPEGTTGLEVVMHTAEYTRTRIMPLMYLPKCSSWSYPTSSIPYIEVTCNTALNTTLVVKGLVDSITSTSISITGYDAGSILILEFLDENENIINITPIFTTELRDLTEWGYNEDIGQYEEIIVSREVVLISLELASFLRTSGYYESQYTLYDCVSPSPYGDILEYCLITSPTQYTRITTTSDTHECMNDGWYKIGTTEFRLLPTTEFLSLDTFTYKFALAKQIEFRTPITGIYDIYLCSNNPIEPFNFIALLYYENNKWWLYKTDVYTIRDNCVIDPNTLDEYCFFTLPNNNPIDLVDLSLGIDCGAYYLKNGLDPVVVDRAGGPTSDDPRVVWDDEKCKFIVTCSSIGSIPCSSCIECTNQLDGESILLKSTVSAPGEVCTIAGEVPKRDYVSACSGLTNCPLGSYPSLTVETESLPSPVQKQAPYVYFIGTSMYIDIYFPGYNRKTYIGNLGYGINLVNIFDSATNQTKAVSFLPFIYLSIFKFPFKYVNSSGLNQEIWGAPEINWTKIATGVSSAGYEYDFKIETTKLIGLIPDWSIGYDWSAACSWLSASLIRSSNTVDKIITVDNTGDIDNIICDGKGRLKYRASNVPLEYGTGIKLPVNAFGAFQTAYEAYCKSVSFLVSKDAEAYAYAYKIYDQELKAPQIAP